jgi:hypothetical protein
LKDIAVTYGDAFTRIPTTKEGGGKEEKSLTKAWQKVTLEEG